MSASYKRLAAIDMGSNSFHLLLAEVSMRGFFPKPRVIARYKHKVRLADGFDASLALDSPAVERAASCLKGFADQLSRFKPDAIQVVATAALRKASNQKAILPKLESALGYPIEIISGEREAALIFSGVCAASEQKGSMLVIDIGGASTEVIVGEPLKPKVLNSLDMGCVVFQNHFFYQQQITRQRFDDAIQQSRSQIRELRQQYQHVGWQHVLGASGTFRALAEIALAEKHTVLSRAWLAHLIDRCVKAGHVQQLDFAGLRDDRRAILCGGLAILMGLLDELEVDHFGVTNGALREGLLAELVAKETA